MAEAGASVVVKTEPVETIDIESRILEFCHESPSGISDSFLQTAFPNVTIAERIDTLNKLMREGKLEILKRKNSILYKLKDSSLSKSGKGADAEEKIVYQIIEKAKNKGVWVRDIRFQSSLSFTQVNKILKSLEGKKLIKSVKPVNASKKKIYMLYDLEPDSTVTGGTWYTDQEFETEFVEVLSQQCLKFLQQVAEQAAKSVNPLTARNGSYKSSSDVLRHINSLKICRVLLKTEDIEAILNSLVYDDKVAVTTSVVGDKTENIYRAKNPLVSCAGLMKLPCGSCTLINDCRVGGDISPATCQYMKDWLSENF